MTISSTTALKYLAIDLAGNKSPIYTQTYIIDKIAPTANVTPLGGIYNNTQAVTLKMSEPGTIYYTLNSTTPTTASTKYATPIVINSAKTLKFLAVDLASNKSPVYTQTYKVNDTTNPTVIATPIGGYYNTTKIVTLKINEPGTIYYTLNGTTPTTTSIKYTGSINIIATTILKYFARDSVSRNSIIYTQKYTIDKIAPTVTANPLGGYFNITKNVTLTPNETSTIYYTTNSTTPTTNSLKYSVPININTTTTLKYFAVDLAGNKSPIYTQLYTIDKTAPIVTAIDPVNNTINVPTNKLIKITYNEPILAGSAYSTIVLKTSSGTIIPITKTISGNVLTITMTNGTYTKGTKYTLTLPINSIKDQANNSITTARTTTFTITTI
jgi:ribosomal protein L31